MTDHRAAAEEALTDSWDGDTHAALLRAIAHALLAHLEDKP